MSAIAENWDLGSASEGSGPKQGRAPLVLRPVEAAQALSMSTDTLARYVLPEIRTVRCGRIRLIPLAELEKWVDRNATCVGAEW